MDKPMTLGETLSLVMALVAVLVWLSAGVACVVWTAQEPGAILMLGMWAAMSAAFYLEKF